MNRSLVHSLNLYSNAAWEWKGSRWRQDILNGGDFYYEDGCKMSVSFRSFGLDDVTEASFRGCGMIVLLLNEAVWQRWSGRVLWFRNSFFFSDNVENCKVWKYLLQAHCFFPLIHCMYVITRQLNSFNRKCRIGCSWKFFLRNIKFFDKVSYFYFLFYFLFWMGGVINLS